MANPNPEVHPDVAHKYAGIVATGRSDFPNQINNVLAFPGIFRGALDVRASAITEGMKLAAAKALADLVGDELAEDYVIPVAVRPARRPRRRRGGRRGRSERRRRSRLSVPTRKGMQAKAHIPGESAGDVSRDLHTLIEEPSRSVGSGACSLSYAESFSSDDPLSGLGSGSGPTRSLRTGGPRSPSRRPRSTTTTCGRCRASASREEALPMILGCDAAGLDEDGNEVVVHAVISAPDWTGDETLDPKRSLLSERHQGTFAEKVIVPRRNVVPKPAGLSLRGGRLPARRHG